VEGTAGNGVSASNVTNYSNPPSCEQEVFPAHFVGSYKKHSLVLSGCAGINRHVVGDERAERPTRLRVWRRESPRAVNCLFRTASISSGAKRQNSASEAARVTGTVLLVEDEDTLRLAVSKMLRKKGLSVIEAVDGSAAVNLFRANEPDIAVVLLDVTLPGMSGPEVFAELRRIRPDIKVIVTTAYGKETTLPIVGGQQSWAFIRKPYQLNDLWNLIWLACRQKGVTAHAASDLPVS
jgi:CheY-like chemotaxis protein